MVTLRISAVVLLLTAAGLSSAVEVPGWDYPPLPGTARGTMDSLMLQYEDVFNDEMLAAIDKEIPALDYLAANSGALRNSKRVTFWRGRNAKPRFAIENMIKLLEQITFPPELGGADAFGIVGCKYWVQRRGGDSSVNFHYDKDEGLASDQSIMRPPPLVGVTHMDQWGAPTVVFNQSTINNGNIDAPNLANEGWFVYPKRNKHCLHRGDLHHGAPADLAAEPVPHDSKRITIITSWESLQPLEPNCHEIPDSELPEPIRARMHEDWGSFGALSADLRKTQMVEMAFDGSMGPVARKRIVLTLGEQAHVDILADPVPGTSYYARWNTEGPAAGSGANATNQAFMGVYELDLHDQPMMNKIHNQKTPVGIIFYKSPRGQKGRAAKRAKELRDKVEGAALEVTQEILMQGKLGQAPAIETYLADASACRASMAAFGLTPKDAPIAVVHYTKLGDRKFIMSVAQEDLPFRKKHLRRFYDEVLNGKRKAALKSEL